MKQKKTSLINKIWLYLIILSITILSFLWLFQVIFLETYYKWVKTNDMNKIANEIINSYQNEDFNDLIENLSFDKGVCIDVIRNNEELYSSNSAIRGCLPVETNSNYTNYKRAFIQSGETKKSYTLNNTRFSNTVLMNGIKLEDDLYVFVNVSLEPLNSTAKILASQLVYVTILVLFLSFTLAYFISKKLSKPITSLSKSAKRLSAGENDVVFNPGGDIKEINELATTLNFMSEEFSKTDELRRELMANVSHDLKTPLTMIKAYAEMVRDLSYNDEKKRNSHLNTIIDETDRLNILVNDILELSKMQSNVVSINYENFDLSELIKSIISKFNYLKETENYIFKYDNNKPIMIYADKLKIGQVIYNLIGNATNYVGKDKQVIINVKKTDDSIKVEVSDHGKGIAKKDINFIWDKYYKTDKNYKRNVIGTGLGLSIVKNILTMHKYEYGVISKENKGTTFYFIIK
ncbi:MAG: ATP-binding protein [Bacilli bacterium]